MKNDYIYHYNLTQITHDIEDDAEIEVDLTHDYVSNQHQQQVSTAALLIVVWYELNL
jgi:hypothetical protein